MRTLLTDDHLSRFAALGEQGTALVLARLRQHGGLPRSMAGRPIVDGPTTGEELFSMCREAGLDQAGVVLSLASETTPAGIAAIEALVGRPIHHWARTAQAARDAAPRATPRGVAVPRAKDYDQKFVVAVVPNPKKIGSSTHLRFQNWVVGRTVAECMAAGLTRADADWDVGRGFVTLGDERPA
jgi:hypothetical protein